MSDIINQILQGVKETDLQLAYIFTALLTILTLFGFGVGYIFGFVKSLFIKSSY